nr:aminotransferase class I/II-fold pyridoxal phosphate-dependent enzyme [Kordiimonas gwangyangensis]
MDLLDKFDATVALRESLPFEKADPFKVVMEEIISETEAVIDGRRTILAGTNNYMGMTFNEEAVEAAKDAIDRFGTGTTGSRVLNGTYGGHKALEATIADFYGMEHCMVFSTGYQANLGMISALGGKDDFVIIDADSHASIYDGCSMGNATIVRFKHNDPDNLERRLKRLPADKGKLVVVEGIYSMLGDSAPLKELLEVSKKYGCMTLVDEAHSMGFCGENGRGVAEQLGVEHLVDFYVGTFSKSVGTVGASPYQTTRSLTYCVLSAALTSSQPACRQVLLRARPKQLRPSSAAATAGLTFGKTRAVCTQVSRRPASTWQRLKRKARLSPCICLTQWSAPVSGKICFLKVFTPTWQRRQPRLQAYS